ncbi:peptide deformylase [Ligilactobacillus sp.]|uniref:peptide deformylase n=1 Tax=Ligilactobacillus sp. TaxID=2767921 RepID=UPI002FE2EDF7
MIRPINKDVEILRRKSAAASKKDIQTAYDLLDTLKAHQNSCVGMAANMIGINKRIIACFFGPFPVLMINPEITRKFGPYTAEEGCLSLEGKRVAKRFNHIEVTYLDEHFIKQHQKLDGFNAQIVQHEIDHCNGILI